MRLLVLHLLIILFDAVKAAPKVANVATPYQTSLETEQPGPLPQGYETIFLDEFNGTSLKSSVWSYVVDVHFNGEIQDYDTESAQIMQGNLVFTARRIPNGTWRASRLRTFGNFAFKYGRVDVRCKIDAVTGMFPAVWMLPEQNVYGEWPKSGEIDIFEFQSLWKSADGRQLTPSTLHYEERNAGNSNTFNGPPNDSADQYHIYTVEWTEKDITFSRDNRLVGQYIRPQNSTFFNWPYDQDFHLIINLALQPEWGTPATDETVDKQFAVDWIRVSKFTQCDK